MIVEYSGQLWSILRTIEDFGYETHDLVAVPRRLAAPGRVEAVVETSVDKRRVRALPSPAEIAAMPSLPDGENWLTMTTRALARLYAAFLVAEDPQRRLDSRKAATLMHQVSLVRHILQRPDLRKVLIGDEVGLGKTIEAGMLIRQIVDREPAARVLYLAPARLVRNVVGELRTKLDLDVRSWVAGTLGDARLDSDRLVVASIHKAVFGPNLDRVVDSGPWDVIVVDECHHLSDWDPFGGKPNQSFKLVSKLIQAQRENGRLILMSGTPHQGSEARFSNILRLLSDDGKSTKGAAGRVIFRTKDRVRDWRGAPLFPAREVRPPVVVELGPEYRAWYLKIGALYDRPGVGGVQARAAGWAKGQALQWAASSVHAGLGFLVRLAIRRSRWTLDEPALREALGALRPYRGGPANESLPELYDRIARQIGLVADEAALEDAEELDEEEEYWQPDPTTLRQLLREAVWLIEHDAGLAKWERVFQLVEAANGEKVVLFAQPVETVTVAVQLLERRFGRRPAVIIGNQSDDERLAEVQRFQEDGGPQLLVSSRAGGEGLNMQRARRLIHLDVPWNPMELEQRIGRVHRFGSRRTILVDTVVAAGSREVDMYRIARDKLALIARQLDPEQFEALFSRVMSLVPPKELEHLMSGFTSSTAFDPVAAQEIGRLVTEGYRSWSEFDAAYREQAEQIRSANPGEARWEDVGVFLGRHGGAEEGSGASFSAFEFRHEEIVSIDEKVPTVSLGDRVYACGDTGGLIPSGPDGNPVEQLGLNLEPVQEVLSSAFFPRRLVGAAFVKAPQDLRLPGLESGPVAVCALMRHPLRPERGSWVAGEPTLHLFAIGPSSDPIELDGPARAAVVRQLQRAVRLKSPERPEWWDELVDVERQLSHGLKRPSDQEIEEGIRYAVWPLAMIGVMP